MLAQNPLNGGEENVQRGAQNRRVALEVIAQALGYGEYPLAYRQTRNDVVG